MIARYKAASRSRPGKPFPQDVQEQLWGAIGAVFQSWMSARAITYRRLNDIPEDWGTAVTVQAMVFGNMGETSATGVAFTRNPSTGEKALYGEFLVNAQGEDVVAGIRTPQNITEQARERGRLEGAVAGSADARDLQANLSAIFDRLENHYRDMQDLEFTIQDGKLWMLQTRSGKRTAKAALKIAVDMANEGLISREEAIGAHRSAIRSTSCSIRRSIPRPSARCIAQRACRHRPGAASGEIVFDADEAERLKAPGPAGDPGAHRDQPRRHSRHACGRGHPHHPRRHDLAMPRWSRAAWASPASRALAASASIMPSGHDDAPPASSLKKGDIITIDGSTGQVMQGRGADHQARTVRRFRAPLMAWADGVRRMKVRANAETPLDARTARDFGAEGIGLCRTEHMFFDADRIVAVREMILADDEEGRRAALAKILPMQRQDFIELFEIMAGLPVTIRLLDPPLHEFLPQTEHEIEEVADEHERRCRGARAPGWPSCTNSTRCSAIAACGWRSPIPRSPKCRPAPFSKRPSRSPRRPARRRFRKS